MDIFSRRGAGLPADAPPEPALQAELLTRPEAAQIVKKDDILKAADILSKYKQGKANLENRIVEDELWWQLRHWEAIRGGKAPREGEMPEPSSAWLFNAILNKHADAMDNFPEPLVLPRELSDQAAAKQLSSILPVVLENNGYDQTYNDQWWEKLKHGTAAYGVFWDPSKENGLGDIEIHGIDLLKLFWEPGITDIQKSKNLFIVDLVDEEDMDRMYPEHKGKFRGGTTVDVAKYVYDDNVDTTDKVVVVDWYYKVRAASGKTLLHYVKFCGDVLLYASENDPAYRERGFYDHGNYPVVLDVMFPEKGTPCGFGYIAICKDPQLYIDKLSGNILETSMMNTKKRWFASSSTNINREQLLDWNQPIIDVEGEIDDRRLKEFTHQSLDGIYLSVLQMKVEEMKDTAANRDVNSGGTGGGITAAAAIAALQEAGNKASRDMISSSYRAHTDIIKMVIEDMRQFYDEARAFRITAPDGTYQFVHMDNSGLTDQPVGMDTAGEMLFRHPVFDLKIKAQKKNPFSRMEQNETAKELYRLGFFDPQRAQEALTCLDMMEFEGVDAMKEKIQQGQTLLNICKQLSQENAMLKGVLGVPGQPMGAAPGGAPASGGAAPGPGSVGPAQGMNAVPDEVMQSRMPQTGYMQRIQQASKPNMNVSPDRATPAG